MDIRFEACAIGVQISHVKACIETALDLIR
jgi:hypothetical protein